MKKIFIILCCLVTLSMCLTLSCYAVESDTVELETAPEQSSEIIAEEPQTVLTRLWEFVDKYKAEALTLIGDVALVLIAIYIKLKNGKGTKEINEALNTIREKTGITLTNQDNVVGVINNLIDAYNVQAEAYVKLQEAYEKYGATELDRNKVLGALAAEIATVLDILSTVYVNNRNLPQGVKDLVTIKYANCLKALENDEELASIVKAVRAAIDIKTTEETAEEQPGEAEV